MQSLLLKQEFLNIIPQSVSRNPIIIPRVRKALHSQETRISAEKQLCNPVQATPPEAVWVGSIHHRSVLGVVMVRVVVHGGRIRGSPSRV